MEYGPPPLFRQGISARARFLFFVLICVILILVDGRLRSLDNFRSAVISFTTPMVHVATLPITLLGEGEGYFISKVKLKTANDQLLEENQKLSLEVARLREMREENERLRQLVNAVPREADRVVTGEVLGRVSDQFTRRLQINLGEKSGIVQGMPVIGAFGILGQITRVAATQSEITLITDHRQRIAVMNERTGERYILAGTGRRADGPALRAALRGHQGRRPTRHVRPRQDLPKADHGGHRERNPSQTWRNLHGRLGDSERRA